MTVIDPRLAEHRRVWERKPALRTVYGDYHRRMLNALPEDGRYLEVGSGSGNLRDAKPDADVTTIDILPTPWVDVCADAQTLPFPDETFDGITMLDVLHHIEHPRVFFAEALRVLKPGGRLAMIEPGITPVSWLFYNFLHEEPVDMSADPLGPVEAKPDPDKDPFDSNQGIPTLLFKRQEHRIAFAEAFPGFTLVDRQWLSLFAYPMTGGFKSWSLLSAGAAESLVRLEQHLMPFIGSIMAFRLMVVLEKRKPKRS